MFGYPIRYYSDTNTLIDVYNNHINKFNVKNIHGKTSYSTGIDIVFGHDVSQLEYKKFLKDKSEEFFTNIKSYNYNLDSCFEDLLDFLSYEEKFNLFVVGHSCSESDNQVFSRILSNDNLSEAYILYYKSGKNFLSQK